MSHDTQPAERRRERRLSVPFSGACVLLVLASPSQAAAAAQQSDGWPFMDEVVRQFLETNEHRAVSGLSSLGAQAAPTAWAVISGVASVDEDFDRSAARERLRGAIEDWSSRETTSALVAAVDAETPLAARLSMLEMLSWTECDEALPALFDVLEGVEPVMLRSRRVEPALRTALRPLLGDDARRFHDLVDELSDVPRELLPAVVETVAELPQAEVVHVLARVAERDKGMEREVLSAIGRHGHRLAPGPTERCIEIARRHLADRDARVRRLAVRAAGRLRDADSFPMLTGLLGDEDAVVRRMALESLQELSGMTRRWEMSDWQTWYDAELRWIEEAQKYMDDLVGDDGYRATNAVRELATHRLFAADVVRILEVGFDNDDPGIRAKVCRAMGDLQHPAAVPQLIESLRDDDDDVSKAARQALRQLSGVDHGDSYSAWSRWWDRLQ